MFYQVNSISSHKSSKSNVSHLPTTRTSNIWELDLSPRPILDTRGKKIWELLITDADGTFVFSEFFPNNKINSVILKTTLEKLINTPGATKPTRCQFFRGQMQTIICRALTDLEIKPVSSRRCFRLMDLLEERLESVYKQHPGYKCSTTNVFSFEYLPLQKLPDALSGEKWAFVHLPASELQKEARKVVDGKIFGSTFLLENSSNRVSRDTLIPGVAVFSRRATPLAAWTNGLELATISTDVERACLILETGINQRWRYGSYQRNEMCDQEAQAWESAKKFADGLHFLAIQPDQESEEVTGLWFMKTRDIPTI